MGFQERLLMRKIKKTTEHKSDVYKRKKREREESKAVCADNSEVTNETNIENDIEGAPQQKKIKLDTEGNEELDEVKETEVKTDAEKDSFDSLDICEPSKKAIADMGFTKMTEIQAKTIPPQLEGKNLVGEAKTGSGKTLAFLIPAIELMHKLRFKPRNGTGVIILSPTRELSMQTFGVLKSLLKYHSHTHALIIGGADKKLEADKLYWGANIVVATPGRLLYHLKNTKGFMFENAFVLVIDEMDKMMNMGFIKEMNEIISILPKTRQTVMFTATRTKKTDELTNLAVEKAMYISTKVVGVPENIIHGYMVCPSEKRLITLYTELKLQLLQKKKVMVFFNSCASVVFHHALFNYIGLEVMCIHGKLKQNKRTTVFFQFCRAESGIMLCTDVASRGLDFPSVDWIIHYDPPNHPKDYVHRSGRTARGEENAGNSIVLLREEELSFWHVMKMAVKEGKIWQLNLPLDVIDVQKQIEILVGRNYKLNALAKDAYRGYMKAYESHILKSVFDPSKLDHAMVARSFGLRFSPDSGGPDSKNKVPNRRERRQKEREGAHKNKPYGKNGFKQHNGEMKRSNYDSRPNRKERRQQMFDNEGTNKSITGESKSFFTSD